MPGSVIIDYLPESVKRYRSGWAVVAIDVIRATTTAITAAASGRRCYPCPNIEAAQVVAQTLDDPILAGELGGDLPAGFEVQNSPAEFASRTDIYRPVVLVSSSGTKVIAEATECETNYLACFRCTSALARHLKQNHERVALIGAGTKDEFREEDQICCAWIAAALIDAGYSAGTSLTDQVTTRWGRARASACLCSRSVDFLRRSEQVRDLDFVLAHIDDLDQVFQMRNGEVRVIREAACAPA